MQHAWQECKVEQLVKKMGLERAVCSVADATSK